MKTSIPFIHRSRVFSLLAAFFTIAVSFVPRVEAQSTEVFMPTNLLPPPQGMYISPALFHVLFANGVVIKDVSHRRFTTSQPPPALGAPVQIHTFGSEVRMMVSVDNGQTFFPANAPAQVTARVLAVAVPVGSPPTWNTEMLQLSISGGTLPAGVMLRESPTRQSTGRTTIRAVTGGFMIDSFFDIFTELSMNGGANWLPAQQAAHVELRGDPTLITPIKTSTTLLPPPNDLYISPAQFHFLFAQGIVIRNVRHRFFTQSLPPPPQGAPAQVHHFDSQVDMEVSMNGGLTFQQMRAPAGVDVRVSPRSNWDGTDVYDTEMLALNIAGGDLPPTVMLRESPTKQSLGGTAIAQAAIGDPDFDLLRIGSFFDIFTEISLDGGQNWAPAQAAAHVVLDCNAPEVPEPSPNLPPPGGEYVSPADFHAAFAAGIVIKDIKHDRFTQSQPPPPPGGSQIHSFGSQVQFQVSMDGGATFNPASAPAQAVVQVSSSVDAGSTRFFNTEMLALNIAGGGLPAGVMLRESPTKASLGRTSIRMTTDPIGTIWDYISSFFDIFVELSLDGGQTWQPSTTGPSEVVLAAPLQPVGTPHFFTTNVLPPGNGVYVSPEAFHVAYANGIIIRNVSHKRFTQGLPPPPAGGSQVHNFGSTVEMDVSTDGGLSFLHVAAPASVSARVTFAGEPDNICFYDTEMLALNISGGGLPTGVMVRESPTRASTGRTSVEPVSGGFMIASFFDIFTEISLDGGQNWSPAQVAAHVDLNVDPTLIAPIPAPTTLLPPPNDLYVSPEQFHVLFAQGIVIRDVKHRFFTGSLPPPPLGQTQTHTFGSQVDMEVSVDGGQTFRPTRAPAAVTVRLAHTRDEGGTQIFDTEMLQLDIQGGDLLPGVMLRESPTKQSTGGTAITPNSDGTHRIGSFFDIFTELSLDGGQNWSPAVSAPAHVELICNAPEVVEPTPNLPPKDDQYVSPEDFHVAFASGIIIKDISHDRFTQSTPPPPPGGSQVHSFQSQVKFRISQDGGVTFNPGVASAFAVVQVSSSVDAGSTRFFDTEMLSLDITGGSLPTGVMLRESPSKASLGRTSIRMVTDSSGVIWDYISSFFDIFVELTLDGGANWQPSVSGPAEVVLAKSPKPHFFTTNVLPPGNGVYVSPADFHAAYANGIIIKNVSHNRFTQGLPPPPPGGTQVHNFGSTVHMDVSQDGGATFAHVSAPASVSARVSSVFADPTGASFYDTEMLALNISGGGLPLGVMVRESPSKASLGRTTIEPVGGGYMIDSFFDIFTEISLDGGQNWSPSAEPGHVELAIDPTLIPPIPAPTTLLPPPNDLYVSPALFHVLFAQGIVIRDVKHRLFTGSIPGASGSLPAPPLVGQSQVHTFGSQVDMEVSNDGGQTFLPARAPAAVTVRVTHTRDEGPTQIFDTEMLQLDIQGGDLPLGVMLRESPTKQSLGGTAITPLADGTNRIGSFFDIFVELSLDGGQNWSPASAPAHVELQCNAPEVTEASPNLPPLGDEYVSPADFHAAYANGIIIKNVIHDRFTQSTPPPPPGGSQTHQFNSRVRFMISQNNGQTFSPGLAFADVRVRVSSSQDQASTRFFDTEMLQLSIHGGSLPTTVMLRESPTKASLGRTSIRMVTDPQGVIWDYISSFFDIFTELSLDGGQNWSPSISGPVEVVLHDADSDADGLPDDWERTYFGNLTHGPDEDADGDGDTNLEELLVGTDPTDPKSVLRPRFAKVGTSLQLSFQSILGHKYRVESKINLASTLGWLPTTATIEGDGTIKTITINPAIDGPQHFYRIAVELSP